MVYTIFVIRMVIVVMLSINTLGKDETLVEKLRSIMAQFEYQYQINVWSDKGVLFKERFYVPEVHLETGMAFCEREDEGHVFKVSLTSLFVMLIV